METLEINDRKLELLKRSNNLLEETKFEYKKYIKERKMLLELTQNPHVNYEEWEHIINYLEALVNLDKSLKIKESDFDYLKSLAIFLREQKTRQTDTKSKYDNIIFKIIDKYNNTHLFLTRNKAEKYIKDNKNIFTDTTITIIDNKNDELEHLLDLIARNF